MSGNLQLLIDKHIDRIGIIFDYLQLLFTDGTILNIFNTYSIVDAVDPDLAGYEIAAVKHDMEIITLFLLPAGTIKIGLHDSDYRGPEAMQYIREGGPCVVWP